MNEVKVVKRLMSDLWPLGIVGLWFVLQAWVLPKLGVPT